MNTELCQSLRSRQTYRRTVSYTHLDVYKRQGYAISRVFVTRTDSGKSQFNYSEVLGSAIAAGISTTYHPASDRTFSGVSGVWGTQVGSDTLTFVVKEFWPDIRRMLHKQPATSNQP